MLNILVTGGAGYIGSHTCKALSQAGYTPIAYDNLSFGHSQAVKWGPLEEGDIQDRSRLEEVFTRYRPRAVMHFAAFAYVAESVEHPGKYYRNNVAGSLMLLEVMLRQGINQLIFSSSCATYGTPDKVPITENHAQHPINPYGQTKYMVEQILKDFYTAYGIRSISLRYFNAAGADPKGEIGEDHTPETHLIPLVLDAALGIQPQITIYGDDYDTPDGTCIRDYIHVTDLASAHVMALKALETMDGAYAYNLGNGRGFSVREVIETARFVTQCPILSNLGSKRTGDPSHLVGDSTRIEKDLGWQPKFADLESIIRTAWNWHSKRA
jgi:UDP-arabinose 4-epimerase